MSLCEEISAAPRVYDLLYRLGATANRAGFFHTSAAVLLAMEQPSRLLLVTKWLYPDVAAQYNTNWKAVERSIRGIITLIWNTNPDLLKSLARFPLTAKPKPAQFLSILTAALSADGAA